jgi:diguanylate cyclase (GGDEF)-like protein
MLAQGMAHQAWRLKQEQALDVDALTGLASERRFADRLSRELTRAGKFELPIAAYLLDLDGFDAFVEAHGMAISDEALAQAAELVRGTCRSADVVARLGGDTYAVLMPELPALDAMEQAEAARKAIADARFPGRRAGGARLTASVGLTAQRGAGGGRKAFMHDLRIALSKAKAEGTGRLTFHARAEAE